MLNVWAFTFIIIIIIIIISIIIITTIIENWTESNRLANS
jgi:hypothetical protein